MPRVCSLVGVFSLTVLVVVQAYSRPDETSLTGIKSVRITVSLNNETSGISSFQLRNDVELKLRQTGIKIDPECDAELRIFVHIVDLDPEQKTQVRGMYGTVYLEVDQTVQLPRKEPSFVRATTWKSDVAYLHGPTNDFGHRCREWARDLTDSFMNAYLSANGK